MSKINGKEIENVKNTKFSEIVKIYREQTGDKTPIGLRQFTDNFNNWLLN